MRRSREPVGLALRGAIALIALPSGAEAHRLPKPPSLELLASMPDAGNPGLRTYVVQVIESPSGKPITLDEPIRASAREVETGLEAEPVEMRPTGSAGVFAGQLLLPAKGRWQVQIEVIGIPGRPLVFEEEVGRPGRREAAAPGASPSTGADPVFWDMAVVGYLIRQWGHLLGFALWLGAALWLRSAPFPDVRTPLAVLWGGLILAHGTALDKMWYSTPPFHETPYIWNYGGLRGVPFAGQYTWVLFGKQILAVTAGLLAVPMTRRLLRATRSDEKGLGHGTRVLILAQVALALGVAGLAVTLGMLHKVVDHFLG